jgi:hypothetical protein
MIDGNNTRNSLTFETTIVSLKLLLFHVYFLRHVGRPAGLSLAEIAANYDRLYGHPTEAMKEALQQAVKEIQQLASWE